MRIQQLGLMMMISAALSTALSAELRHVEIKTLGMD